MEYVLFIASYLVGGIPFGLLLGKWVRGVDLREHGSKNLGATNAVRVLGKPLGITAFVLDFAKGAVPVVATRYVLDPTDPQLSLWLTLCGFSSIMGHVFPIYLKFKGGKGVATSAGVLLALTWKTLAIAFACWLIFFFLSKIVSLASLLAALCAAVTVLVVEPDPWGQDLPITIVVLALFVLIVLRHRANIGRLLRGEENSFKKTDETRGAGSPDSPRVASPSENP